MGQMEYLKFKTNGCWSAELERLTGGASISPVHGIGWQGEATR